MNMCSQARKNSSDCVFWLCEPNIVIQNDIRNVKAKILQGISFQEREFFSRGVVPVFFFHLSLSFIYVSPFNALIFS